MATLAPYDSRVERNLIPEDQANKQGQIVFSEGGPFSRAEASEIFGGLNETKDPAMQPEQVRRGGKTYVLKRRTAYFGNRGACYGYGGILKRRAVEWGQGGMGRVVDRIRERVEKHTGRTFSYCLVNYYPNGTTGLGFHADDESDLDPEEPIVSVSFGASRDMVFKHKRKEMSDIKVALTPGSVVEMHPPLQSNWKHAIPPRTRVTTGRFNLTFRALKKNECARDDDDDQK